MSGPGLVTGRGCLTPALRHPASENYDLVGERHHPASEAAI